MGCVMIPGILQWCFPQEYYTLHLDEFGGSPPIRYGEVCSKEKEKQKDAEM